MFLTASLLLHSYLSTLHCLRNQYWLINITKLDSLDFTCFYWCAFVIPKIPSHVGFNWISCLLFEVIWEHFSDFPLSWWPWQYWGPLSNFQDIPQLELDIFLMIRLEFLVSEKIQLQSIPFITLSKLHAICMMLVYITWLK